MTTESITERKAYALRYYASHCFASSEYDELFRFARDHARYKLQRLHFPENVSLAFESARLALERASYVLDILLIAEFSVMHAKRVTENRTEGLLESFKLRQMSRSRELSQTLEPNLRAIWNLLLLAEIKKSGDKTQYARLLDEVREQRLVRLSDEYEELAALLIAQLS